VCEYDKVHQISIASSSRNALLPEQGQKHTRQNNIGQQSEGIRYCLKLRFPDAMADGVADAYDKGGDRAIALPILKRVKQREDRTSRMYFSEQGML
jgi:hypothetical protein